MKVKDNNHILNDVNGKQQGFGGVGHHHICHQMTLIFQGRDSWDRPVYKGPDRNLYVDVDPRKGWGPNICTKYQNEFDGEPDEPVEGVDFVFTPYRDVW